MFTTTFRAISLAMVATILLAAPTAATQRVPGNNGTLKVHEQGTPSQFINNDPKVCNFNFEGYNFDLDQDGLVVITTQGGGNDRSEVKRVYMPAATAADTHGTYTETEYLTLPNGHYKTTVYGKDKHGAYNIDLKAKSKVFKVDCKQAATATPAPPATPATPGAVESATTSEPQGYTSSTRTDIPQIAPSANTGKGAETPRPLPDTGMNSVLPIVATLLAGAVTYATILRTRLTQ